MSSSTSVGSLSPGKRQSQIPVLSRFHPNSQRVKSKKGDTSIDVISPESFTHHSGTGPPRTSKANASEPRSNTPLPEEGKLNRWKLGSGRQSSSSTRSPLGEIKPGGAPGRPGGNSSVKKDIAENGVNYTKSYTTITLSSPGAESSDGGGTQGLLTPDSKGNASTFTDEELSPGDAGDFSTSATESKTSLDMGACPRSEYGFPETQLTAEYSKLCRAGKTREGGPRSELLDLGAWDGESLLYGTAPGSGASSPGGTRPDEGRRGGGGVITGGSAGTAPGDEPAFSSLIGHGIDGDLTAGDTLDGPGDGGPPRLFDRAEDEDLAHACGRLMLTGDDANGYDSGGTASDAGDPGKGGHGGSGSRPPGAGAGTGINRGSDAGAIIDENPGAKSNLTGRGNEILTDVSYRQSVYHPTVLKRRARDCFRDGADGPGPGTDSDRAAPAACDPRSETGPGAIKTLATKNATSTIVCI